MKKLNINKDINLKNKNYEADNYNNIKIELKDKKVKELIKKIEKIKNSNIREIIEEKTTYFKREKNNIDIFIELSFCILTANYDAEKALKIERSIKEGFLNYTEEELSNMLKTLGYRYPNIRSKFIVYNRKYYKTLKHSLKNFENDFERREWLIKDIKGFGMKEASHFLRNIGYFDVAIVDFHILDLLERYHLLKEIFNNVKKNDNKEIKIKLNKKLYIKIELVLRKLSNTLNIPLGILDLYLWYIETGKIVK